MKIHVFVRVHLSLTFGLGKNEFWTGWWKQDFLRLQSPIRKNPQTKLSCPLIPDGPHITPAGLQNGSVQIFCVVDNREIESLNFSKSLFQLQCFIHRVNIWEKNSFIPKIWITFKKMQFWFHVCFNISFHMLSLNSITTRLSICSVQWKHIDAHLTRITKIWKTHPENFPKFLFSGSWASPYYWTTHPKN